MQILIESYVLVMEIGLALFTRPIFKILPRLFFTLNLNWFTLVRFLFDIVAMQNKVGNRFLYET